MPLVSATERLVAEQFDLTGHILRRERAAQELGIAREQLVAELLVMEQAPRHPGHVVVLLGIALKDDITASGRTHGCKCQ